MVALKICNGQEEIEQMEEDECALGYAGSAMMVELPQIGWNIESLPNIAPSLPIAYLDQEIPSSMRMNVPSNVSDCHLLLKQGCNTNGSSNENNVPLSPSKHASLLRSQRRLKEIL